jgi:ABC-type oligopeptide transport system substrate-binding subunit
MKIKMKYVLLIVSALSLNACMDDVSHFWNYGTQMQAKEEQTYRECFAEVDAADPEMAKVKMTKAELREFYNRLDPCLNRKGY